MNKRNRDYLFLRPDSHNWHIRLYSPDRRVERSLGTPDRRRAEILALPMVAEHKRKLLEAKPHLESTWQHQYAPGRQHAGPDGGTIIATTDELIHLDASGKITDRTANGKNVWQFSSVPLTRRSFEMTPMDAVFNESAARPSLIKKTSDDEILETYLNHASVTGYYEREARAVWMLYKQLTNSTPLKDATRNDGRRLVAYFDDQGLKSASIKKKLTWLTAMCNLAISEGVLKFNPFSSVIPKRDDKVKRLPLDDADIALIKSSLDRLSASDQVLFRLLATTGMRLSEAFQINREWEEHGVRFVIIGGKTKQSLRRVPLPEGVLPYLPTIKGALFTGSENAASKRLCSFLRKIGIADPRKVVHSLRHRAQDRLRAAGCPEDQREAILGHEEMSVAAGYGEGFSMTLLRPWIDKISF